MTYTHEHFIHDVVNLVRERLNDEDKAALDGVKIVYGTGPRGARGVTYYQVWKDAQAEGRKPLIEICAFGQRDRVQVAGTTIHEIGHVLAGWEAGHGKPWKEACERAGLRRVKAAGTNYVMTMIAPGLRQAIAALPVIEDGEPNTGRDMGALVVRVAGVGVRGGKSRGPGSGSRMVKMQCAECGYVARAARKWIDQVGPVHCPEHGEMEVCD